MQFFRRPTAVNAAVNKDKISTDIERRAVSLR